MRVIVWGINYAPEVTGIGPHNAALCEFLAANGHDVRMITTFSYYPEWRKLPEDRWKFYRTDVLNGIPVHRCWHYVPARISALSRIFHEFTFVKSSFLKCLSLPRADLMVVVSPPLLLGAAAWLAGLIKRTPFVFHVQDLQPDAAVDLGMLKKSALTRFLYALESFAYRKAARVSGISRGMLEAFRKKGVPEGRLVYFPNGITLPANDELTDGSRFRLTHGFYRDDFVALYSGNLGVKHGLENVIEAARLLENGRIKIILCGAGSNLEPLELLVKQYALKNILFLPLQLDAEYKEMLCAADLCLITQQKGSGQSFFPSKLLNALAFGKPVLTIADRGSELARVLEEGHFGENAPPEQPAKIAAQLEAFARDPDRLAEFGKAGRTFVGQFERKKVLGDFVREITATGL
ncbi:MAG: WcaI family glycosyltransferase [Verrucomicrobiota bacterium]